MKTQKAYMENEYRMEKSYIVRDREASKTRTFINYTLRMLCGYIYKKLCEFIGNMSMSEISRLSNEGFRLMRENIQLRNAFISLIHVNLNKIR